MKPEEAIAAARAEVERLKALGRYAEPEGGLTVEPTDRVSRAQLLEWALIEPDVSELRSTRRGGAPVTALKRLLLRGLQQYHNELIAEQTRFNIHVLRRLFELEDRLDELAESVRGPASGGHYGDHGAAPGQPPSAPLER